MVGVRDPVGSGLVASLARPGGNITGLSNLSPELVGKQLEFLKEVLPTVSRVAVLWNPANPGHALMVREADVAAQALGVQLHLLEARGPDAFDSAFAAMTSAHAGALLVLGDSIFFQHRRRLVELAATSRLPTMYHARAYVEAGGLISYGSSHPALWRRAATYVDKILKGAKPADLPVEQPTKFELVINLKTARHLGSRFPRRVLFQADEVVEVGMRRGAASSRGTGSRENNHSVGVEVWGHPSLTTACKRRPIASARPSLRLLDAPEAQRSAALSIGSKKGGNHL